MMIRRLILAVAALSLITALGFGLVTINSGPCLPYDGAPCVGAV